jgi:peptidoglycan-N-acetylglucosamine deacetylase
MLATDTDHFLRTTAVPAVRFRPTVAILFIVSAPFLTFLLLLVSGRMWGLSILFASHMMLVAMTLVPTLQGFGPVVTKFSTDGKSVWLTIDDGPDPETTPQILALLEAFDARATFFLIGSKVAEYPALTRMILAGGHTIGNHTQTHPRFIFWRLGPRTLAKEIDTFEATISSINAPIPIWFRAPAGMKNPFLHPVLAARGLHLVAWSARAFDTQIDDSHRIVRRIKESLSSGAIILFHETDQPSVCLKALEQLLCELAAEKFQLILPRPSDLLTGRRQAFQETC